MYGLRHSMAKMFKHFNAFTYDAMGNILTQERHNRAGQIFDDLEYKYQMDDDGNLLRNRLYSIKDDETLANVMEDDIEDMDAFISAVNQINTDNNYSYDAEGRLVKDRQEEIDTIIGTVSGKVKEIHRSLQSTKKNLTFEYDAFGNRIAKHVYDNQTLMLEKSTYYILDAQGNQLSMYEHIVDDADVKYYLTERNIYGSSRLGTLKDPVNMFNAKPLPSYGILGNRNYELSNHLGNVLTVISDIKYPLSDDNTTITGYEVGISNIFDYSPFGAPLDGRTIENIFHQEEITDTSTVLKTIYVLEETFDVASDWQAINSHTEITYPSGRMRVRNSASTKKTIGAEKDFTTGTGQHTVSFDVVLPIFSCTGAIIGTSSTDSQNNEFNTTDTLVGVSSYQILSYSSDFYAVVEIRDENNSIVLKDSTNMTATHSYTFSAPQGKEYNISLYSNRFCPTMGFHFDNVFISYDTLEVVTGNTIIVSDTLFIINNDFENPIIEPNGAGVKIDGWTHYSPSTTLSVEPHNGSDWLKVVSTNGTHGAHQGFSVEPGETYTFEIDLHRPAGMNNEINIVIWKNTGPSGAYTLHVLNTDGSNTFNYTATSSNIYIQIRQAGTYYLDNIRMYRTYDDTMFVGGYEVDRAYRYGYNTQERVPEIQKDHYTAPYWEYDPRVVHRWNRDPKPVPSISPYAINQGNPIWFSDPLGDTVKVEGSKKDIRTFIRQLNRTTGNKYGVDDNGILYNKKDSYNKETTKLKSGILSEITEGIITHEETFVFKLTSNSQVAYFDNYDTGEFDVKEFKKSDRIFQAGQFAHIFMERMANSPDYSRENRTDENYKEAHNWGMIAEGAVVTSMLNIKFAYPQTTTHKNQYTDNYGNAIPTFWEVTKYGDVIYGGYRTPIHLGQGLFQAGFNLKGKMKRRK